MQSSSTFSSLCVTINCLTVILFIFLLFPLLQPHLYFRNSICLKRLVNKFLNFLRSLLVFSFRCYSSCVHLSATCSGTAIPDIPAKSHLVFHPVSCCLHLSDLSLFLSLSSLTCQQPVSLSTPFTLTVQHTIHTFFQTLPRVSMLKQTHWTGQRAALQGQIISAHKVR